MSKKQTVILVFIGILILLNSFLLATAFILFPEHWGFTRYIIFIHPNEEENNSGYFIIVDELMPKTQQFDIDWVLHGRGNLTVSEDFQTLSYSTKSYISNDIISLNASFLSPIQKLTDHEGEFFPTQNYEGVDKNSIYIKAKYSGMTNPQMGTVLYPNNESDSSTSVPSISSVDINTIGQIGVSDLIYYQVQRITRTFSVPNDIESDAKIFFIHKNELDKINYFFVQDSSKLSFENKKYFESSEPVVNLLINYGNCPNEITGIINIDLYRSLIEEELIEPEQISIYVPFEVSSLIVNGVNTPFESESSLIKFDLKDSCSFIISKDTLSENVEYIEKNPLQISESYDSFPDDTIWQFNSSKIIELEHLDHPYLLFNATELDNLKDKIHNSKDPWNYSYFSYVSDVDILVNTDINTWDENQRVDPIRKISLKFAIQGGQNYLEKIKEILLDMGNIENDYSMDLSRSYAVQAYAIAYDIIYKNISAPERVLIEDLLESHAQPLSNIDLYPENNHCVVNAGGLGLAGLILKNKTFIDIATEAILTYLYEKNRPDGASYEGQSYLAFAYLNSIEFLHALNRLNAYNFFNNTRFQNSLDFMAHCLSPLATTPLFEDATTSGYANEILLISAAQISNQQRAKEYQWLWEHRKNNTDLLGLNEYNYLLSSLPNFRSIVCYDVNEKIEPVKPEYASDVYKDSNMAFLRSGYSTDSIFLSFSCKNYTQSHPHYDENSFELWAYGAWLVMNPGYPGWGNDGHDYTISTESSNTLLINNKGQLNRMASGFKSAIISPYFDMVQADATRAYNSPGSMAESVQVYIIIILIFSFLGISTFLILDAKISIRKRLERGDEQPDLFELQNISIIKDKALKSNKYSLANFLEDVFMAPKAVQKRIFFREQKSNLRVLNLIISGTFTVLILLCLLYIASKINSHLLYYEEQYDFFLKFMPLAELILIPFILIFTFIAYYAFIRLFARICNYICSNCDPQFPNYRKQLKNTISVSLAWQLLILGVGSIFIWFTIMWGIGFFIHDLFQSIEGINEVIYNLFKLISEAILVLGLIVALEILFFTITVQSIGYSISLMSEARIKQRDGVKITLATLLIILCIIFMIILIVFFSLTYFTSILSIEGLTGG